MALSLENAESKQRPLYLNYRGNMALALSKA